MAKYDITTIDTISPTSGSGESHAWEIDSTHIVVVWQGTDTDGFVGTFSHDGDYDNWAEIDVLEWDTLNVYYPKVTYDGTSVMIMYRNSSGYLDSTSLSIDGSYELTEVDNLELLTADTYNIGKGAVLFDITTKYVMGIIFVGGTSRDAYIRRISADSSQNLTDEGGVGLSGYDGVAGSSSYDIHQTSIAPISNTHAIVTYTETGSPNGSEYLYLRVHYYTGSFFANGSDVTVYSFVSKTYWHNDAVMLTSTLGQCGYSGNGDDGYVRAFTVSGTTITLASSLEHDTTRGRYYSGIRIDDTNCLWAYEDGSLVNSYGVFSCTSTGASLTEESKATFSNGSELEWIMRTANDSYCFAKTQGSSITSYSIEIITTVALDGIASTLAFGDVDTARLVGLSGIASTLSIGVVQIVSKFVDLDGIASTLAIGSLDTIKTIVLDGIASTLQLGEIGTYRALSFVDMPKVQTRGPLCTHVTVTSPTNSYTEHATVEPPAADRIERLVTIDEGNATVCQNVAEQLFAKWSVAQVSVTGTIDLNLTLSFKEKIRVIISWAGIDEDMILQKKSHNLETGRTEIVCGDIILSDNELLARILDDLGG